jgi:hypothetical protein
LDMQYGNKQMQGNAGSNVELATVVEKSNPDGDNDQHWREEHYPANRFLSKISKLNTLGLQTTITRSQANEDSNAVETEIINANGTWQSISKWGEKNRLDTGQQTAFEILAATYVLSFYDEATSEGTRAETYDAFLERQNGLCQLARRKPGNEDPLCMFLTGPAGAGKCKLLLNEEFTFTCKNRNLTLL